MPVTEITPKIEQVHEEIEELIRNINVNDASLIKMESMIYENTPYSKN